MTDARVSGIGVKVLRKNAIPDTRISGIGIKVLIGSRNLLGAQLKVSTDGINFVPATMKVWDSATSTWKTYPASVSYLSNWLRFQ